MNLPLLDGPCRRCGARADQECADWCPLNDDMCDQTDEHGGWSDADPGL